MTENKNRLRVQTTQPTPVVFKDEAPKPVKKTKEKSEKPVEKPVKIKATRKPESKVAKRHKEHTGRGRISFGILILLISVFLLIAFANPYLGYTPKGKWLNYLGEEMSLDMFGLGTAYQQYQNAKTYSAASCVLFVAFGDLALRFSCRLYLDRLLNRFF